MVNNSLSAKSESKVVEFEVSGEKVKLSPGIIRNYLVSGSGNVSDQEVVMFLNLCRYQHLNPFLREAYLIKFGNLPATMVIGKETFTKRARRNKDYKGEQAGVCVIKENGEIENRIGALVAPNETLVGGYAKIFVDGYTEPVEMSVSLEEYIGRKQDGTVNAQWKSKPATMIRKVALVQALREAFPEDFAGMYCAEEMDVDLPQGSETPIDAEAVNDVEKVSEAPADPLA